MSRGRCEDLHIYLLKGFVSEGDDIRQEENFLGNWVEDGYAFLFFSSPADESLRNLLRRIPDLEWIDYFHFTYEQWQGGGIEAVRIPPFFITCPWKAVQARPGELKILLDPGVVFGNGLHPTTRHCLQAMAYSSKRKPIESVLDMGTGTGILAIAAAFLGAKEVLAVDLNPLCVKTAAENVIHNNFRDRIRVIEGPAGNFINREFDMMIANMPWDVIKGLLKRKGLKKKRRLIFSGLMRSAFRELKYDLEERHFSVIREWDYEMTWFTCLAEKTRD